MQPYFIPYIGYFQLIKAVDVFVFYDDVNYIKNGWINRNRVLVNQKPNYITIPLIDAGSNKLINEIGVFQKEKSFAKILKTIEQNYKKAPYFEAVFELIKNIFNTQNNLISDFIIESTIEICKYLDINTKFVSSSIEFGDTKDIDRADRLIEITKKLNADTYINAIGGQSLYDKTYFKAKNIELMFLQTKDIKYQQQSKDFFPHLSIIDILMNNSKEEIKNYLNQYELI